MQHLAKAGEFGVVTMATNSDAVVRACALAASLQHHQPDWPVTLLTTVPADVPGQWFSSVLPIATPERFTGELRYLNKLIHPFTLSPYERTLFLDDDTLVVRPFADVIDQHFAGKQVAINCRVSKSSDSLPGMNHLIPPIVCGELDRSECWNTYGGGHMYFERGALPLLEAAIAVVIDERHLYERWSGQTVVSDEIALLIAANRSSAKMPTVPDFVDALTLRQAGQIRVRVTESAYSWPDRPWGTDIGDVAVLHFASSAKLAASYAREIYRLTGLRQRADRGLRGRARRLRHDLRRFST